MEILLQIIEEEVNVAFNEILQEYDSDGDGVDDGGGYGGGYGGGGGGGGGNLLIGKRSLLMSPVVDVANAFKKFAAKATINVLSTVATLIGGTIAALLPFNDPRTVKWIGKKFAFWESESLKFIDEQFKTETAQMQEGWQTFKNDFWGIGFVASPFGAIAAAATAAKGIDGALSVANVITGGRVGKIIDHITADATDPGDLESFLQHGKDKEEKAAKKGMENKVYSDRCIAQLDNPNWVDSECLGFAQRNRFPSGPKGQQEYIDFITGNLRTVNHIRRDRYKIDYGRNPGYDYGADEQDVINLLKQQGYISEGFLKNLFANKKEEAMPSGKLDAAIKAGMSGEVKNTPIAPKIANLEKKFGKEKTNELLKAVALAVVKDPTAKTQEQAWVTKNLPIVANQTMSMLNDSLKANQVPEVAPEQIEIYKNQAGNIAQKAITDTLKNNKKFKASVPPEALQAVKVAVDSSTQASLPSAPAQQVQPQPAPQVPQAIQPQQPAAQPQNTKQ